MDHSIVTTLLWIAAAGVLSMWLARRKKRRILDK
jgi:hypothetical protein